LPAGIDLVMLYLLLSLALLSPLASDDILPEAADFANHTAFVVEARNALTEGSCRSASRPTPPIGCATPCSSSTRRRRIWSPGRSTGT